eukprot:302509_1
MMSFSSKHFSKIDNNTKLSVFGFIRKCENNLKRTNDVYLFHNIPLLIHSLCLLYYHVSDEFEIAGKDIKISKDHKSIMHPSNWYHNTSYGKIVIQSTAKVIYKWELKIDSNASIQQQKRTPQMLENPDWLMFIAISASNVTDQGLVSHKEYGYMYCSDGEIRSTRSMIWKQYGSCYDVNDAVGVVLDLQKKQISFEVNGNVYGVAFENIETNNDIEYRLAVSLRCKHAKVTIKKFTESYAN